MKEGSSPVDFPLLSTDPKKVSITRPPPAFEAKTLQTLGCYQHNSF